MKHAVLPLANTTSTPFSCSERIVSIAVILMLRDESVIVPSISVRSAFSTA
jgi:hypothetical protein